MVSARLLLNPVAVTKTSISIIAVLALLKKKKKKNLKEKNINTNTTTTRRSISGIMMSNSSSGVSHWQWLRLLQACFGWVRRPMSMIHDPVYTGSCTKKTTTTTAASSGGGTCKALDYDYKNLVKEGSCKSSWSSTYCSGTYSGCPSACDGDSNGNWCMVDDTSTPTGVTAIQQNRHLRLRPRLRLRSTCAFTIRAASAPNL